jgi:hypothetical protein
MDRLDIYKQLLAIKPFFQKTYNGTPEVHLTGKKTILKARKPPHKSAVKGGALVCGFSIDGSATAYESTVGAGRVEWYETKDGTIGGAQKNIDHINLVYYEF